MDFLQRMREFEYHGTDGAFEKYAKDDPRRELAHRAKEAFFQLIKARVSAEVYAEIRKAYLAWDEAAGDYEALTHQVHYWQGFRDGLNVATADIGTLAIAPGRSYDEREVIAKIEQVEKAAKNGAAEKEAVTVGV